MNNPTDTNQASELFELCKEVYEKAGWQGDFLSNWGWVQAHGEYEVDNGCTDGLPPLYTSDYLLEKLPSSLNDDEGDLYRLTVRKVGDDWLANYVYDNVGMWHRYGTTPLKALLKLTIALSEAGEL